MKRTRTLPSAIALAILSLTAGLVPAGSRAEAASPTVVGAASDGSDGGWTTTSTGTVAPFGGARAFGDLTGVRLAHPVVGMAATPDAGGYWLVASDGGIFTFGDARFYGSTGGITLRKPVVGIAATPDAGGYWLVASDGGIFTFGDAPFYGSASSSGQPVAAIAAGSGGGYLTAGADGLITSFGPTPAKLAPPAPVAPNPSNTLSPATAGAVSAIQVGSSPAVTVSWRYPFSAPAADELAQVYLMQVSGSSLTQVSAVGCVEGCTSHTFYYLVPGATYVAKVIPYNGTTSSAPLLSSPVALSAPCPSAACVTVDSSAALGPADHVAQGLLHATYAGPDSAFLDGLGVTMYRGTVPFEEGQLDWSQWQAPLAAGVPTTLVVSDAWWLANGGNPPAPSPSELPAYAQWLTAYITQILASGNRVDYFEPYNEPGSDYYSPTVASTVTASELYQLFLVTYQVIKSLDPNARIVGPSQPGWYEWPIPGFEGGFNIVDFLEFAAANHIELAAVNFHDFAGDQPLNLVTFVAEARRLVSMFPQIGHPAIFVNENGDENTQRSPGWDVGYLAAATESGADMVGRSCWLDDCWLPDLDGLLSSDGTQPLPDYWVRSFYGSMGGQLIATSSTDPSVQAVASYDSAASKVDLVVGRGVGCADTGRCGTLGPLAAPLMVTINLRLPWLSGSVTVVGRDISGSTIGPYQLPTPSIAETVAVPSGGSLYLPIPAFRDGDAWTFEVTRS